MSTPNATDRCIIEISGEAVGMVIEDEGGFVFHAAAPDLWPLNRQVFRSVEAATRASRELLERKRQSSEIERNPQRSGRWRMLHASRG